MKHPWSPEEKARARDLVIETRDVKEAHRRWKEETGIEVTLQGFNTQVYRTGTPSSELIRSGKPKEVDPIVSRPVDPGLTAAEILEDRKRRFVRKQQYEMERKLLSCVLPDSLPVGILHFGDPHLDDDGTDIGLLEQHVGIVQRTAGLYAATVGDETNNWVGRLAALWKEQATNEEESWKLAEWFLGGLADTKKLLYVVGGNHDAWSGAGSPLYWIAGQRHALIQESEVRIGLQFPGDREVRINCRHDFPGSSIYNPAHGAMKALTWGTRDHIATCGHKHVSGYGIVKDPDTGITMHAVQVGSYKVYDRFARKKGFRDQMISPCCLTTINPGLPDDHPDLVKPFWDPVEGAEYLTWLRAAALRKRDKTETGG